QVAESLGYRLPGAAGKPAIVEFDAEAEQVVRQIGEVFRHLPPEKVQCALDFAGFLRAKIDSYVCPPPAAHVPGALREVRDLVVALQARNGVEELAEKKGPWTERDGLTF